MGKYLLFFVLVFIFTSCNVGEEPTLEQKVSQMLMVGFRGTEVSTDSQIVKDMAKYQLGGVILFEYDAPSKSRPRNIVSVEQVKKLVSDLQSYSQVPLFVAIDEEGGMVSRLKSKYGFSPTVKPSYLGKLNNEDTTRFYAKQIAKKCASVGINVNFAPSVDVNVNPNCPIIGMLGRSFSDDYNVVAKNAKWFIEEHNKQGVLCTIKHFPGHGSSVSDTHLGIADVSHTWSTDELKPFSMLLADKILTSVMTSHIFNKNLDSIYPATLSKSTLSILRNQFGFKGVIFSDDMMMKAITNYYGFEESICLAINAGVDVLVFSNNISVNDNNIVDSAMQIIVKLVNEGKIDKQQIDKSYKRIIKTKKKLGII